MNNTQTPQPNEQHNADHAKLMKKMAKVIQLTGNVKKKGQNQEQHYKFAQHSDIIEELRKHIADVGIFIIPSPRNYTTEEVTSRSGTKGSLITMCMEFVISDAETGYSITTKWFGQGMDYGDKAIYKSYTGALKYFLLDTFMISTGDDPENDSPESHTPKAQPKPVARPAVQPTPMTKYQLDTLAKLLDQKGKNPEGLNEWSLKVLKLEDWHDMNSTQAILAIKKLQSLPDLQPDQITQVEPLDLDEVDKGIEKMRNDAKPGAQSEEIIH